MYLLTLAVASAVAYFPNSPRPEKVFLRLLGRFFRQGEFLLSHLALDRDSNRGLVDRWRAVLIAINPSKEELIP